MTKVWQILKAITDIKNFNVLANKVGQNSIDSPNLPNFSHAKLSSFTVLQSSRLESTTKLNTMDYNYISTEVC